MTGNRSRMSLVPNIWTLLVRLEISKITPKMAKNKGSKRIVMSQALIINILKAHYPFRSNADK